MGFLTLPQRNQTVDRSHPLLREDRPAFTCRGRAGRRGGFGAVGLDGAVVAWGAAGHLQWDFQKRAVGPVHKQVGSDVETVTAEKYADAQMAGSADRPRRARPGSGRRRGGAGGGGAAPGSPRRNRVETACGTRSFACRWDRMSRHSARVTEERDSGLSDQAASAPANTSRSME